MSIEIGLQRIDAADSREPKHASTLGQLRQTVQGVLAEAGRLDDTTMADDGQSFTVMVPGGTASVYESCAVFPLARLDPFWFRMVYAVARAGDMMVVGDGLEILTNSTQVRPAWVSSGEVVPSCSSPDELRVLLEPWFMRQVHYADEMRRELSQKAEGGSPGPPPDAVYIQLRGNETVLDLLDASGRFYRAAIRDRVTNVPKHGACRGTTWLLCTPAGEVFNALIVKGDKKEWFQLLGNFASSQSRLLGQILNGETFLVSDGRRFALDECTHKRSQE